MSELSFSLCCFGAIALGMVVALIALRGAALDDDSEVGEVDDA